MSIPVFLMSRVIFLVAAVTPVRVESRKSWCKCKCLSCLLEKGELVDFQFSCPTKSLRHLFHLKSTHWAFNQQTEVGWRPKLSGDQFQFRRCNDFDQLTCSTRLLRPQMSFLLRHLILIGLFTPQPPLWPL